MNSQPPVSHEIERRGSRHEDANIDVSTDRTQDLVTASAGDNEEADDVEEDGEEGGEDEEDVEFKKLLELDKLDRFTIADFSFEFAMVRVYTALQRAWRMTPPEDDVSSKAVQKLLSSPPPPLTDGKDTSNDLSDWESEWRKSIYEQFNHIFHDTAHNLLPKAPVFGHFHPPNHTVFALQSSACGDEAGVTVKHFDTPTMFIPAYIGKGVRVKIDLLDNKDDINEDPERGRRVVYNACMPFQVVIVGAGQKVRFSTEQMSRESVTGVPQVRAVMVCGHLCQKDDRAKWQMESEENRRIRVEVQSSQNMLMALFAQDQARKQSRAVLEGPTTNESTRRM